ncbi:MAG: methyltransferase domain-containing protein [Firmicutes bacterium]|nr:methyltransferase domain-containing protein [Bacillota bacterium]
MEDRTADIQHFMAHGLLVSPWLAGVGTRSRFNDEIFDYMSRHARAIIHERWSRELLATRFGDPSVTGDRIPRTAIYEIAASTAVWIAQEETGTAEVTHAFAELSWQRVEGFLSAYGVGALMEVYSLATRYENYQAIAYYAGMSERDFILGHLHRPWIDYSLQDELNLGVHNGNLRVELRGSERVVLLTEQGESNFRDITGVLQKSGYLDARMRHLNVSRFNSAIQLEPAMRKIAPDWITKRVDFVDFIGIAPGMQVLEIGCGDGILTVDGHLAARVGPTGRVIAIDPSMSMLLRAQKKAREADLGWVEFLQGRVEELPFADGTFDVVIAAAVLHLTDIPRALQEMRRVVRPGGIVGSLNVLPAGMDVPFFVDWMEPIMKLARREDRAEPRTYLISRHEIERLYREAGLWIEKTGELVIRAFYWWPQENVDVLVRGLGWAQEELANLPWAAREEIITAVQERGEEICRNYSPDERILRSPMHMIKTIAPR